MTRIGGVFPSVEINITNGTGFTFNACTSAYKCKVTWKTESPNPFDVFSVPIVSRLKVFPELSITKLSAATVKVRFGDDTRSCGIPGRYEGSGGQLIPSTASHEKKQTKNKQTPIMFASSSPSTSIRISRVSSSIFFLEIPSTQALW